MSSPFPKRLVQAAFLLLSVSSAFAAGVEVRVGGGLFGSSLPDLNSYLRDATRHEFDGLKTVGYVLHSGFEEARGGRELSLSLSLPIADHLALEAGAGYQKVSRRGNAMALESSFAFLDDTRDLSLVSLPVFLGLDYGWPLSRTASVHLFASGGLVFSRFKESGEEILTLKSGNEGHTHSWTAEASATGYGFQAGLGLEVKVAGPLGLFLRGGVRTAKVAGFTGRSTAQFNASTYQDDNLRLYYYEFTGNYPAKTYAAISLPNAAQGSRLEVIRDANLGLSGPFIGAGLRLSL
jgi:hypothetical protein